LAVRFPLSRAHSGAERLRASLSTVEGECQVNSALPYLVGSDQTKGLVFQFKSTPPFKGKASLLWLLSVKSIFMANGLRRSSQRLRRRAHLHLDNARRGRLREDEPGAFASQCAGAGLPDTGARSGDECYFILEFVGHVFSGL
jgi:hypothetical protein